MHLGQSANVLKTGVVLVAACLLTSACGTNTRPRTVTEDEGWIRCHPSGSGEGWDCVKGTDFRAGYQSPGQIADNEDETGTSVMTAASSNQPALTSPTPNQPYSPPDDTQNPEEASVEPNEVLEEERIARYRIQLAAFQTQARRDAYIKSLSIDRSALTLSRSQRAGQTWWLVSYGNYQEYADALEAQTELAQGYGLTDTWIRPLE